MTANHGSKMYPKVKKSNNSSAVNNVSFTFKASNSSCSVSLRLPNRLAYYKLALRENSAADISTDLILDSATASQLVAVTDGDYNGRLQEKGIPSLQGVRTQRENTFISIG